MQDPKAHAGAVATANLVAVWARLFDRNPGAVAVIHSQIDERMKGRRLPAGDGELLALIAELLPALQESEEVQKALKKLDSDYHVLAGTDPGSLERRPEEERIVGDPQFHRVGAAIAIGGTAGVVLMLALGGYLLYREFKESYGDSG